MKALQIDRFGPLDELHVRDVADAALPVDCVRIEVEAAGVNPSDVGVVSGHFPQVTLPRILGRDFAGRVVEGPPELVGLPVWGSGGGILGMTRDGTHAEHLILPVEAVTARPAHLTAEQAAVAGVPFVTAWSALVELAEFGPGQWALIAGAAGAVGSSAVALAKVLGGYAIALVRSTDDLAPLEGLGADATLRSDVDNIPVAVAQTTGGHGADVALNGVGASVFAPLAEAMAKDGRLIVFSAAGGREVRLDLFDFYRRRLRLFGLDTASFSLAQVARAYAGFSPFFESRAIAPPPIAARFPLERARDAYERIARGDQGKVVLVMRAAGSAAAFAEAAASRSRADAESAAALV